MSRCSAASEAPNCSKTGSNKYVFSNMIVDEDMRLWRNAFEYVLSDNMEDHVDVLPQSVYPMLTEKGNCWVCIRLKLNASSMNILGIERAPPKDEKGMTYLAFIAHLHRVSAAEELLSTTWNNSRIAVNWDLGTIRTPMRRTGSTAQKRIKCPTKTKQCDPNKSTGVSDAVADRARGRKELENKKDDIKMDTCNLMLWPLYPAAMEMEQPKVSPSVDMDADSMGSDCNKINPCAVGDPITALLCVAMSE
ncbi:unnamed protein product, partial [Echinostoma caproni]|uniref:DDE_Tnp_1_7 domain-containing protein n=1 Tax=Echinostoma caproni TaxID=27848 RepID=A0A183B2V5_9TREM